MPSYSMKYRFVLPDYDVTEWNTAINNNFIAIDSLLAQFTTTLNIQGAWANGNYYTVGQSVIDTLTGHIWLCSVNHTSSIAPATFAQDRATYATYWTDVTNPAIPAATSAAAAAASAVTAVASASNAPFRNRLINGAFDINQRGLAFAFASSSGYTSDRWMISTTGTTANVSLSPIAGYLAATPMSITATMAVAQTVQLVQRIESVNAYDLVGQQITLSIDTAYTVSSGTTTFVASIIVPNALDNYAATTNVQSLPLTPSAVPGILTATFAALPASVKNGFELSIVATQGVNTGNFSWTIGGVQLEAGAVATPFERIPYDVTLQRCQRYYQVIGNVSSYGVSVAGQSVGLTTSYIAPMRTIPAVNNIAVNYINCSTLIIQPHLTSADVIAQGVSGGSYLFNCSFTLSADI